MLICQQPGKEPTSCGFETDPARRRPRRESRGRAAQHGIRKPSHRSWKPERRRAYHQFFSAQPLVGANTAVVILTAAQTTLIQDSVVGMFNVPIVVDNLHSRAGIMAISDLTDCPYDSNDGVHTTAIEGGISDQSTAIGDCNEPPIRGP